MLPNPLNQPFLTNSTLNRLCRGNFRALLPSSPTMGAVHASEMAPPPTAEADRYVRNKFHAAMYYAYPRNPGTVEELHARWKEMLPQPFEGAKLLVQKGLSNNFQARNHDLIYVLTLHHRSHMHLQCQTRCQVGTGGLLSQKCKFEINASRFGATYVGASKIISMQVGVGKVDIHHLSFNCRRLTQSSLEISTPLETYKPTSSMPLQVKEATVHFVQIIVL